MPTDNSGVIRPRTEKERIAFWEGYDQAIKDVRKRGFDDALEFRNQMAEMELRINSELNCEKEPHSR